MPIPEGKGKHAYKLFEGLHQPPLFHSGKNYLCVRVATKAMTHGLELSA